MTLLTHDLIKTPAAYKARKLMTAVSVFSLIGIASCASAQMPVPIAASAQQSAVQVQQTPEAPAPITDDRFKPRVYGGTPQAIVVTPAPRTTPAPVPAPIITQPTSAPTTLPVTRPVQTQQQVNVVMAPKPTKPVIAEQSPAQIIKPSLNAPKPAVLPPAPTAEVVENMVPAETATSMPDVNPGLAPNSALNSAPNWPNGIRSQFVDVIVGAPILIDPVSCEDGNPSLRIKVVNVKNSKGIIVADLHDDVKENFLDWEKVVLRVRATATEGETNFCMPVPTSGTYAVAIYHDKNSNAFFDKNFLGLPKERFGMSNNPKFSTKSPKFEEAIFEVPAEGVDMLIKLRKSSDVISGKQD